MGKTVVTTVEENAAPAPAVVRTKFQVTSIGDLDTTSGGDAGQRVNFEAVARETADGKLENAGFAQGKPVGYVSLEVTHPDLIGHFEAGAMYYVDISAAAQ